MDPRSTLLVDGRAVGPVEVADRLRARGRGLLGRAGLDGALLLVPCRSVHTWGMRFALDVALCDRTLTVFAVATLPPGRVLRPRTRTWAVVEAEAGRFDAWGLTPGSRLDLSAGTTPPRR